MNWIKITLFCLLFSPILISAQTQKQYIKAAQKNEKKGAYYLAIAYYEKALTFPKSTDQIHYAVGNCYTELKDYDHALSSYQKVANKKAFPFVHFYIAENLTLTGNYSQAITHYDYFLNQHRTNDDFKLIAKQKKSSCFWAIDQKHNELIKISPLPLDINTAFSEFSPTLLFDSALLITAFYPDSLNSNKDYKSAFFTFKNESEKWLLNQQTFPFFENKNVANAYFLKEKNKLYFNVCENLSNGKKRCDIYVSTLENNSYTKPIKLNINDKNATQTQAFAYVDNDGKDILYFISDRENGIGNLDIWMAKEIENGLFSTPYVLPMPINTILDEASPYYSINEKSLYFSSQWHYGFGGFDQFKVNFLGNDTVIENLGLPYNSSADDLYLRKTASDKGLFSSNRKGAQILKGISCCYDIFSFEKDFIQEKNQIDSILLAKKIIVEEKQKHIETLKTKINNLLPVTVYFHNDEPNPKSTDSTTTSSYSESYKHFNALKSDYYAKNNFNDIDSFFYDKLTKGWNDLKSLEKIIEELSKTQKINVVLSGYCSPLAKNDYNINLAKRRIAAVKNEWIKNSILNKAITENKIVFSFIPFGEEKANSFVSDDYYNTDLSIYSVRAALERKVSIVTIIIE